MAWNLTDGTLMQNVRIAAFPGDSRSMLNNGNAEKNFAGNILSKLKQFKDDKQFCDLEIQVQEKSFFVHKALLAASSPVLASSLSTTSQTPSFDRAVVTCENVSVFEAFLNFLYTENLPASDSAVEQLISIASSFKVDALFKECEIYFRCSTTLGNFVSRYFLSLKYGLKQLEEYISEFVRTNIADIIQQKAVASLTPSEFYTFFSTGLMTRLEREIRFSLILGWVSGGVEERERYLIFLFGQIEWLEPVNNLLLEISCTDNIFMSSEFCLFQLLHTVMRHGHDLGHFAAVFPRLSHSYCYALADLLQPHLIQPMDVRASQLSVVKFSISNKETLSVAEEATLKEKEMRDVSVNTDVDSNCFTDVLTQLEGQVDQGEKEQSRNTQSSQNGSEDTGVAKSKDEAHWKVTLKKSKLAVTGTGKRKRGRPRKYTIAKQKMKVVQGSKRKSGRPRKELANASEVDTSETSLKIKIERHSDSEIEDTGNSGFFCSEKLNNTMDDLDDEMEVKNEVNNTFSTPKSKTRKSSQKHLSSVNLGKPNSNSFRCSFDGCTYITRVQSRVEKHIENFHNAKCRLKCHHCEFETPLMRELCFHLKQHYNNPPYKCDKADCSFESVVLRNLVYHLMEHNGEMPYICDICSKSFRTMNRLSCHQKLHEGRQFVCDVCGKSFTTKGTMKQHRAIHFDQKPYLCDTCGFTTKHQSHLISHRKIHTGEVLRCKFPDCTYSTPKQGHMTQHMNGHLNIRDHICQVCGKSFTVRGKLLRHELIHLDHKLYKCRSCDYRTSRTDRMKLHVTSHGMTFDPSAYEKV